jgi:hypothetical protein
VLTSETSWTRPSLMEMPPAGVNTCTCAHMRACTRTHTHAQAADALVDDSDDEPTLPFPWERRSVTAGLIRSGPIAPVTAFVATG